MKTIYDNEAENARYYENKRKQRTECAAMAWTICAFALFCMIVGAVVMKIAIEGWG